MMNAFRIVSSGRFCVKMDMSAVEPRLFGLNGDWDGMDSEKFG